MVGTSLSRLLFLKIELKFFLMTDYQKSRQKNCFLKESVSNNMLLHIFKNMNLTEHTGHGIPVILPKYGEDAFDINESYIQVSIYYDQFVLATLKDGKNVGLNSTEKKVISLLLEHSNETADSLAANIGVTKRTTERTLKKLQEKGLIAKSSSKKT